MKTFFGLLLLTATLNTAAQKTKPPVVYQKAISISPLALADVDHTLMLTGEYRFNNKLALVTDVGYIFASEYIGNTQKTWGFNIRPSIRMYYGKRNKGYLQGQVFYKLANYTLHDWVGKDCVNGVPSYQQEMDFDYRKKVMGFNLIAGGVLPLSQSHQWLIDLYGGLGFRHKKHQMVNQPNSCYSIDGGWVFNFYNDEVTTISVPMGVRLTYVLK
jgi:hypothetical protein